MLVRSTPTQSPRSRPYDSTKRRTKVQLRPAPLKFRLQSRSPSPSPADATSSVQQSNNVRSRRPTCVRHADTVPRTELTTAGAQLDLEATEEVQSTTDIAPRNCVTLCHLGDLCPIQGAPLISCTSCSNMARFLRLAARLETSTFHLPRPSRTSREVPDFLTFALKVYEALSDDGLGADVEGTRQR